MDPSTATAQESGPGLSLNLNSNNPFRAQASGTSPIPSPALLPVQSAPVRQSQTNPFLASFEQDLKTKTEDMEAAPSSPSQEPVGDDAKELFKKLTITDKEKGDKSTSTRRGPPNGRVGSTSRRPPPGEIQYRRGPNGLMIPIRPREGRPRNGSNDRRQRRNSESSIQQERPLLTEEERKERDRRRKEREARHRDRDESRDSKTTEISHSKSGRRRRNVHVDVVDQMDVTGLYGVGGMWHHDGPFDACRPHRNRKKDALAPINAFPLNSANNTIGGSGPVNAGINLEQFHGLGTEGFHDYGSTGEPQTFPKMKAMQAHVVNPTTRVEPIHGEESLGLGTSTFLEGAPASRQAIQRTQSEQDSRMDGLTRTKSLAVRLRAMSTSKRYNDENRPRPGLLSPDKGRFQDRSGGVGLTDGPLLSPGIPDTIRPATAGNSKGENNPFDATAAKRTSYDEAYDKKGATIKTAELKQVDSVPNVDPTTSPSKSPRGAFIEHISLDDPVSPTVPPEPKSLGNSLLNRVKSLKGGPRRMKSERNPS